MIVVDTNIIAYFYLPSRLTQIVEGLLIAEPVWAVPTLWRSEFRNVLALYLRKRLISFERAIRIQSEAESMLQENEFESNSIDILELVNDSTCSAYDCEFVALAKNLNTKLVTADKKVISEFPDIAFSPNEILKP